jgi:HEPN domain-containing protein
MKRQTAPWVRKAEDDLQGARQLAALKPPLRDLVCFHCQQAVEKYLKALLREHGAFVPKTHDLNGLLGLLLPQDASLAPLARGLDALTRFAVEYRYPIVRTSTRQMRASLRLAERVRTELRIRLGLPP